MLILSGQGKGDRENLLWRAFVNKDVAFHHEQLMIPESCLCLQLWFMKLSLL